MQIVNDKYDVPPADRNENPVIAFRKTGNEETDNTAESCSIRGRADAVRLLARLRAELPLGVDREHKGRGGGRRDYRRWLTPDAVWVEIHDGSVWNSVETLDCSVPGVRVIDLPESVADGPVVVRLTTPIGTILVLGNVMWSEGKGRTAGLYFEFNSDDDREAWFEGLVEALLSDHALN